MNKNILVILFTIILFSCNEEQNDINTTDIETTLISKGNLYGAGEENIGQQNLIITNQNTWLSLLNQMDSVNNVSDSFSETAVDFSESIVLAVFDEIRGNGGHSLELNVSSNSENIIVDIIELNPEGNVTTVMTQPYIIVKMPKSNLPIDFQ